MSFFSFPKKCPSTLSRCFSTFASMKKTISSAILVIWSPARSSLRITVPSSRQVRKLSGCVSRYFCKDGRGSRIDFVQQIIFTEYIEGLTPDFLHSTRSWSFPSIPSTCFSISSIAGCGAVHYPARFPRFSPQNGLCLRQKSPQTLQITVYLEHGQHKTQVNGYRIV